MNTKHKIFFSVLLLLVCVTYPIPAKALSAESAAVIDVETDRILYEKNADVPQRIASLTKIMTAIVAIENGNLDDIVTVSKSAYGVEGSSIYLRLGEKLTLHDLLYGIMLRSGNDAATAIAEHVGGSIDGFVELMNAKAHELGMPQTAFINPHGLDERKGSNFSTAHDMAILTAYALRNPVFAEIVSTKSIRIPYDGISEGRYMQNKNKMLHLYKGGDGVKTGYTILARRCLASSATRDGWQVASIVLRAPDWYKDSMHILDEAYSAFEKYPYVQKNQVLGYVPIKKGKEEQVQAIAEESFTFPVKEGEEQWLSKKITLEDSLKAPVKQGQTAGKMELYFQNERVKTIRLIAAKEIEKRSWWENVKRGFGGD